MAVTGFEPLTNVVSQKCLVSHDDLHICKNQKGEEIMEAEAAHLVKRRWVYICSGLGKELELSL